MTISYQVKRVKGSDDDLRTLLNTQGAAGWRAVQIVPVGVVSDSSGADNSWIVVFEKDH